MTDRTNAGQGSSSLLTSGLAASSQSPGSSVIRSRNRRHDNAHLYDETSINLQSGSRIDDVWDVPKRSRNISRSSEPTRPIIDSKSLAGGQDLAQFLGDSWTQSWTSVQSFASSILSNGNKFSEGRQSPQARTRLGRKNSRLDTWGPLPPSESPLAHNIAAGSPAHRQAALKAAKTASVLESYEGVNGGLDTTGIHKRRKSDESAPPDLEPADRLVYVHEVQPNDTYAGIILRYKCREDVFRKSNRLWSRDSVQTRKWLILPVDACEIKGRPLGPQSGHQNSEIDHPAPAPSTTEDAASDCGSLGNNFLSEHRNSASSGQRAQDLEDDKPWTHVRWVQIDSFAKPVRIARVSRQSLGYFPPRRKRSIRTISPTNSPRQTSDLANPTSSLNEGSSPRQLDSPSRQPPTPGTSLASHGRVDNELPDTRPSWMRRPGGVGSMNIDVKEPGPDNDFFNTWAKKHLPGLDLDTMPSMSVMGSDSAHFGFGQASATIVENPLAEGRDVGDTSRLGSGLDRAAAAIEHWVRGALTKRPSTPLSGNRSRPTGSSSEQGLSDLIELRNAISEADETRNLLMSLDTSTTARTKGVIASRDKTSPIAGNAATHKQGL
ncbi:hypothetical protein E4U42_002039 [Claviceps africana]|uniref:LysM domain-containing protein n=1 Tax=Claviceps africana TaxID=83212 RepID=A0A8K0J9B5_9HYPO|nr:hypothetical protein E4U42_002039 [Claviceps africana]